MSKPLFRWWNASPLPARFDLRRCGWSLVEDGGVPDRAGCCPVLVDARHLDATGWVALLSARAGPPRGRVLLLGVADPHERARLLRLGFGDVQGRRVSLPELDARATRIAEAVAAVPRRRVLGPLTLDLLRRDAFAGGKALGLHPREFALVWRLLETPGEVLSRATLYAQVWHRSHLPETNSIAVHIFRLRAKLELAGLGAMVRTAPGGGYYAALPDCGCDDGHAMAAVSAAATAP